MKIWKIKNIEIDLVYLFLGIIAFCWTAWSSIHDITNIPSHHYIINKNGPGVRFITSTNIFPYTKSFTTFFYFTTLSNFLFSIVTLIRAFYKKWIFSYITQKSMATYMIITGVVFWMTLSYMLSWNDILVDFELVFLHLINPIISIILVIYIHDEKKKVHMNKFLILKMLSFPLLYYLMAWIFYIIISGNAAIYPFLDFYHLFSINMFIVATIIINIIFFVIFIIFLIVIFIFLNYIANKKIKKAEI